MLAGDPVDAARRLVGAVREQRLVASAVELRARVVGHAAVDRRVRDTARFLDRADAVERHAGAADERPARLEDQRHAVGHEFGERADELRDRRQLLVAVVPDAEPATEVEHARCPGEPLEEREHPLEGEHALVGAAELRADVDVEAVDLEPELPCPLDLALCGVGSKAELRLLVGGLDRAVRDGLDARRQAHEHAPHAGGRRRLRLTGRIEDDERIRLRSRAQLLLRLVVAVEDEPLARNSRRPRERELAERRDVGADALLAEQPQQRDVRERLRPVDDERARRGLAIRATWLRIVCSQ